MSVKVITTRTTNVYVGLSERANFANRNTVDLFVSYHLNAATASAHGYEDYTYPTKNTNTINARNTYHDNIKDILPNLGIVNRGKKTANFAVLRETNMPAILVELGFISNLKEYNILGNNINSLAKQHALAIKEALIKLGKPNGKVCIDPGHGGHDPGAVNGNQTEAAYVLKFALLVRDYLMKNDNVNDEEKNEEKDDIMLTETGRKEIRELLKKARTAGIIDAKYHTDDKIAKYNDSQLLSYQAAVINRTFK